MTLSLISQTADLKECLAQLTTYQKNLSTLSKSPIAVIPLQLLQRSANVWQLRKCDKHIQEIANQEKREKRITRIQQQIESREAPSNRIRGGRRCKPITRPTRSSKPHSPQLQGIVKPREKRNERHEKERLEARFTECAMLCFLAETSRLAKYLPDTPLAPVAIPGEVANLIGTSLLCCAETQSTAPSDTTWQIWKRRLKRAQYACAIASNVMFLCVDMNSPQVSPEAKNMASYTRYMTTAMSAMNLLITTYENRETVKKAASDVCSSVATKTSSCFYKIVGSLKIGSFKKA